MTTTDNMTGAELQTLREGCGLSREDFASLAGVQARTVKHWEGGRAGVPADVAALACDLESALFNAVLQKMAALWSGLMPGDKRGDVVLIRYRQVADMPRVDSDLATLPKLLHGAFTARVRDACAARGAKVRVVWMERAAFDAWLTARNLADTEASRAAWAADQVQAQALPHRADQPQD